MVEILRHGELAATRFLTLTMTDHAHFTCIPLRQLNRIVQHPGRLGVSHHLDSGVVNCSEQTYPSFVLLRFSIEHRHIVYNPTDVSCDTNNKRERERGREGERETLVAPRNIVHRRIAARHATFDNFIIMNSSSSKKLYPFRIDIRSRSCSKSITLSRASDEIESLSARDRPQAMVSNVRLQTSSCFSRSEHASSTVCLIFQ